MCCEFGCIHERSVSFYMSEGNREINNLADHVVESRKKLKETGIIFWYPTFF